MTRWLPSRLREAGRRLLRRSGFVVHRWPAARFDAMEDALQLLRRSGFTPGAVVDVGANRGEWARKASQVFPEAQFHLVEPQPGCVDALRAFAASAPNVTIYSTALTRPNVATVLMAGGGEHHDHTGGFVVSAPGDAKDTFAYPATTVDALFGSLTAERVLLKLDVEGHELHVLEGAAATLHRVEVIVTEFWMYRLFGLLMPTFGDLVAWLQQAGFVLYDFAALSARRRDNRLRSGDAIFVRRDSALVKDDSFD